MQKSKLKKLLQMAFYKSIDSKRSKESDVKLKTIICLVFSFISLILTILNIFKSTTFMTVTTSTLVVSFLICALLVGKFKLVNVSGIIIAVLIAGVFSIYAVTGQNDGFAILWILLIPMISMMFLSVKLGTIVSLYFQLLLIIIFYTPVKHYLPSVDGYTSTFMMRFPVLYFGDFFASIILAGQKNYYANKSEENSLFDSLTSLRNRRFYNDFINSTLYSKLDNCFTVISLDLNNLKTINDSLGHAIGDEAIVCAANCLKQIFDVESKLTQDIYRTGGDEFVIFLNDKNNLCDKMISELKDNLKSYNSNNLNLSISAGVCKKADFPNKSLEFLINCAEKNMYIDKDNFYKTYGGRRHDDKH